MDIIKCKNLVTRKGITRECGSFLMKMVGDDIHLKCRSCDHYAVISVINGQLTVLHLDKKGEETICQIKK